MFHDGIRSQWSSYRKGLVRGGAKKGVDDDTWLIEPTGSMSSGFTARGFEWE